MVSHDLPCSIVTNQIAFDQRDSNTIPEFECTIDRRCQALVSKLETLVPSLLPNCFDECNVAKRGEMEIISLGSN